MQAVTGEQMRLIDHFAIERYGIPEIVLVENAAIRTIDCIDLSRRHTFAVFCGTGNNGADGLAVARGLVARAKHVRVFIVGNPEKAGEAWKQNYEALQLLQVQIKRIETLGDLDDMIHQLDEMNTLIDCLFGTGLNREIRGTAAIVIEQINRSRTYTISVDLPSGIDATTGRVWGCFVEADAVICLQLMKTGLQNNPYVNGEVIVVPAGIPQKAIEAGLESDNC